MKAYYYSVYNPYMKQKRFGMKNPHTYKQIEIRKKLIEDIYGLGVTFTKREEGTPVDIEILNIIPGSDEWLAKIKEAHVSDRLRDKLDLNYKPKEIKLIKAN